MQRQTTITQQKRQVLYRIEQALRCLPLFSFALVLLLLLMFYLSSRAFPGVTTDVTNACAEATRDEGTTGTSCHVSFFFSSFLLLTLLPGYLLYREVGSDWRHGKRKRFDRGHTG